MASCQSIAAKAWLASRTPAHSLAFGPPAVETHSSGAGRGLGLFANRALDKHAQVLADAALILMQPTHDLPELYSQFLALPSDQQQRYLALSLAENPERDALLVKKLRERDVFSEHGEDALMEMAKVASIMQTNAFNVDLGDGQGSRHRALFPILARVNHSCMPNAHVCYYPGGADSDSKGRMVVHSLRALKPGEEILISYFDILLSRADRQARTVKWGFVCRCPVCDEDANASDGVSLEDQRRLLREWLAIQGQAVRSPQMSEEQLRGLIDMGLELIANAQINESLTPAFPNLYDGIAMLHARLGLWKDAENNGSDCAQSLEESAIWEARITGPQSRATTKRLDKLTETTNNLQRGGPRQRAEIVRDDDQGYRVVFVPRSSK